MARSRRASCYRVVVENNSHLEKAKAALEHARELIEKVPEEDISSNPKMNKIFLRLVDLASVQSGVAQAEALERIADAAEVWVKLNKPRGAW